MANSFVYNKKFHRITVK